MTISDLKNSAADFISAEDAAEVIGCNPQSLRSQAQADPKKLGFPVVVIGARVRIPRLGFIAFVTGGLA